MLRLQDQFPVRFMAERLEVSPSGFYRWRDAEPSERAKTDERLRVKIRAFFEASRGTYGSPRIHEDLVEDGESVSRQRVARIMREEGLVARPKRRFKKTTRPGTEAQKAQDLVQRGFSADAPNKLWVSDISYVRTWQGWVYVAVILDVFSRRVVGYAIDDHMRAELVVEAFEMAVRRRGPVDGLVFHSDRGSQYTSARFREKLRQRGVRQSMGSVGDCFDNAVAESFFATLKHELIYRHTWPTQRRAIAATKEYIENFYNLRRRHSAIGLVSPVDYELGSRSFRLAA